MIWLLGRKHHRGRSVFRRDLSKPSRRQERPGLLSYEEFTATGTKFSLFSLVVGDFAYPALPLSGSVILTPSPLEELDF